MTAPDAGSEFDDLLLGDEYYIATHSLVSDWSPPTIKHNNDGETDSEAVKPPHEDQSEPAPNEDAMNKIEEWALEVLEELASGKATWAFETASCRKKPTLDNPGRRRRIIWPSKRTPTLKTIAGMAKVAEMSHVALKDDIPTTKRDIFYSDVELFGKQAVVDSLVDDFAATLGLRRADLNTRASLKGLFCGSTITLTTKQGEVIRGLDHEGTLIPVGEDIVHISADEEIGWGLIVEKDAVFQTLCQLGLTSLFEDIGPGVMVTGKGYPDIATRQLVSIFSEELPSDIPLLGLVDADSHGLDILSTYKFGSKTMTHENDLLVAPRIEWIGVKRSDIEDLGINESKMLRVTSADARKAESMLHGTNSLRLPDDWITELETMLDTGLKAEIEIISGPRASRDNLPQGAHALAQYVHGKILAALTRARGQDSEMNEFEDLESPEVSYSSSSTEPELETPTNGSFSEPHIKLEPLDDIDLDFEDDF